MIDAQFQYIALRHACAPKLNRALYSAEFAFSEFPCIDISADLRLWPVSAHFFSTLKLIKALFSAEFAFSEFPCIDLSADLRFLPVSAHFSQLLN